MFSSEFYKWWGIFHFSRCSNWISTRICLINENSIFFLTGSYYKHLTVSNEVISHKQTIEQTNHPQCQLVLIRFDRNNNFIFYFRMYLVLYSQHLRLIAYFNVWLEVIVTLIYGPKTTTENKAGNLFLSPLVVATFKLL